MHNGLICVQNNKILSVNKGAERILVCKAKEVLGRSCRDFFRNIIGKEYEIKDIFGNGRQERCSEVNLILKNDETIPVIISFVPLKIAVGIQDRVSIIIIQDLSERKKIEKYLHRMDRMRAMGELTAGIVHEIRNPLASISTNVQYVKENMDSTYKYYEEIQDIIEDIKEIEEIIQRMLDFARPKRPQIVKTDIHQPIDDSLRFTKMKLRKNKIETVKEYGTRIPDIEVDPEQIKQVFLNLIYNACQAMLRGGRLTISTAVGKTDLRPPYLPYVEINFIDTGSGIPRENIRKVFNPFFTTNHEGTGLGLSISQRIIEEHKGSIEVDSQNGKGTRFTIKLPINPEFAYFQ